MKLKTLTDYYNGTDFETRLANMIKMRNTSTFI